MTEPVRAEAGPGRTGALLVLMASAAVLGLAPVLVRLADTGPASAGFWRLAFALPLLAAAALWSGRDGAGERTGKGPTGWMALAAIFFISDLAFWHYSIGLTSVANATVLTNLTPVVVTIAAWLLFRERPRLLFVIALALAVGGAWMMSVTAAPGREGSNPALGDLFAVISALWYAGYFLTIKQARRTAGALRVMAWSTALAAPMLLAVAVALNEDLTPGSVGGWAAVAGLGIVHVAGQGGVAWALGRLPTALTAVTVLIQPVVAAILGWLMFAEAMTPLQALGGAAVLGGVVLAQAASRPRPAEKKTGAEP